MFGKKILLLFSGSKIKPRIQLARHWQQAANFYLIARRNSPEDNTVHSNRCENLKSNRLKISSNTDA
jgi:hypothetical protein